MNDVSHGKIRKDEKNEINLAALSPSVSNMFLDNLMNGN